MRHFLVVAVAGALLSSTGQLRAALNDEIVALVRSGAPLEANLAELGGDLPGALGNITTVLAERAKQWKPRPPRYRTGCLGKYTALATSADTGGALKWDLP